MTSTLVTWRRRCLAAEERASSAETRLKRTQRALTRECNTFAALLDDYMLSQNERKIFARTLRHLAAKSLGQEASRGDVTRLCAKWVNEARRRERADDLRDAERAREAMLDQLPPWLRPEEE